MVKKEVEGLEAVKPRPVVNLEGSLALLFVNEIPFPEERRPLKERTKKLRSALAKHWKEGGEEFKKWVRNSSRWYRLTARVDWKWDEYNFSLGEIAEILKRNRRSTRRIREALMIGKKTEEGASWKEEGWQFNKMEFLQLLVGISTYVVAKRDIIKEKKATRRQAKTS